MITASAKRTEIQYRALPVDSSSTLKDFVTDPKKYFQKYVVGEPVEEEDSKASLLGSIVHTLLLEPHLFDSKYYASTCASKPTEKMLEFTNMLYEETIAHTNEEGVVYMEFSDIAKIAYNRAGYGGPGSWKIETVLTKWREGTGESYYTELLHTKPRGLQVVTEFDMKNAEDIVNTLKTDDFVSGYILQDTEEDIEVYTEVQLEGPAYQLYGLSLKGMVDKIIIQHTKKIIFPLDLKVTWEPQNFYEGYYLYRRAYIQAFVYWKLLEIWADENGFNHYKLEYPKFIVADSGNFYRPLTYELTNDDMIGANSGFVHRGRYYKGVQEIITDLKWARDSNEWKISRSDYSNKGRVTLNK